MALPEICVARLTGYRKSPEDCNEIGVLFVVLKKDLTACREEISEKIFDLLKSGLKPEEVCVIQDIIFVDSIPVTTCGKVDRVALKNLALERSHLLSHLDNLD